MYDASSNGRELDIDCLQEITDQFHLLELGDGFMNHAVE